MSALLVGFSALWVFWGVVTLFIFWACMTWVNKPSLQSRLQKIVENASSADEVRSISNTLLTPPHKDSDGQ